MKVAIVHDDLVQWGGAERVLQAITEVFPEAPIYTSLFNNKHPILNKYFRNKKIITSFLQKIPGWKILYKTLLPLYPIAFEQFNFEEYDLVISQTTRFAKAIIAKPETTHIAYIHTPPRFLWNFSGQSSLKILNPYFSYLKRFDKVSSTRPDFLLAGSKNAKTRIEKIYEKESKVLYPFVDLNLFDINRSFDGGYFLIIARLNKYKRVDLAVEVFNENPKLNLKIIGIGTEFGSLKQKAKENIQFVTSASEDLMIDLVSGCKGLIITAEEDFGMSALEAQAMGKAVLALGKGGSLETVVEGKTGIFFKAQTKEELNSALDRFIKAKFAKIDCYVQAKRFSKENFKNKLKEYVLRFC